MLWILMLSVPFPYIANLAGWWTAELGRQPWLVFGWLRTSAGSSTSVHSGNVIFTILGFAGMYVALFMIFLYMILREVEHGPVPRGIAIKDNEPRMEHGPNTD